MLIVLKLLFWVSGTILTLAMAVVKWMYGTAGATNMLMEAMRAGKTGEAMRALNLTGCLEAAASQVRAQDPKVQEMSAWMNTYGANPHPSEVPEFLAYVQENEILKHKSGELPFAGAILALIERHPEMEPEWRKKFGALIDEAKGVLIRCGQDRVGWNEFYMVQWLILRTDEAAQRVADRTAQPGEMGATAVWMINSMRNQIPEFDMAMQDRMPEFRESSPSVLGFVDAEFVPQEEHERILALGDKARQMGIPPRAPTTPEEAQAARVYAANLQGQLNEGAAGATITGFQVHEDTHDGITSIAIHTSRGTIGMSSPLLFIYGPGIPIPTSEDQPCPTR